MLLSTLGISTLLNHETRGIQDSFTNFSCLELSVTIKAHDTCAYIAMNHSMELSKFIHINSVDCNNLVVGSEVCVDSHMQCNKEHALIQGSTCTSLALTHSISITHLKTINPFINCTSLTIGFNACITDPSCAGPIVKSEKSCLDIASFWGMTLDRLIFLNLNLDCTTLKKIVCVDPIEKCDNRYRVKKNDTIDALVERFGSQALGVYNSSFILVGWPFCIPDIGILSTKIQFNW